MNNKEIGIYPEDAEDNPYKKLREDALLFATEEVKAGRSEFVDVSTDEAKFDECMRICAVFRVTRNSLRLATFAHKNYAKTTEQATRAFRFM